MSPAVHPRRPRKSLGRNVADVWFHVNNAAMALERVRAGLPTALGPDRDRVLRLRSEVDVLEREVHAARATATRVQEHLPS